MKIQFLQAFNGDSIWISFSDDGVNKNILIDGGTFTTYSYTDQKGKGKATDYVPGAEFFLNENLIVSLSNTPPSSLNALPIESTEEKAKDISDELKQKILRLGQRVNDVTVLKQIIKEICKHDFFKSTKLANILNTHEHYIKRKFLTPMIAEGELEYLFPEMLNHLEQSHRTKLSD